MTLAPGCEFHFTSGPSLLFPGLAISLWAIPLLILYGLYRVLRFVLLGTGPWTVQLFFPTEEGRPSPNVALYDVAAEAVLPAARVVP
jgi:hypothetical protein